MKRTVSLTENTLFKRLYYRGKPFHSKYCVLYTMPNRLQVNRLGFTVGKKIGKAVQRNRARRRLFEAFRIFEADIRSGCDIVIVAKSASLEGDFADLVRIMGATLKKAGLLQSKPPQQSTPSE